MPTPDFWDREHSYVIDMIKVLLGHKHGMRNVDFAHGVWEITLA